MTPPARPHINVVVIADDAPANTWLIREIERRHELQAILRPDWNAVRSSDARANRRDTPPLWMRITGAIRSRYFALKDRADQSQLARLLLPDGPPSPPRTRIWTVPAWEINSVAVQEQLAALAPDLVVVSGAPILKSNIFDMPRLGTLNLHFGIVPAYRGMHTIVTPWQRGEFSRIGATLHHVTDRIDDGPVVFRVYPALDSRDDHISAEAKIVKLAAAELSAMLTWIGEREASAPLPGLAVSGAGELIRFHDRKIRDHLQARLAGPRAPDQEERIERYYRD